MWHKVLTYKTLSVISNCKLYGNVSYVFTYLKIGYESTDLNKPDITPFFFLSVSEVRQNNKNF